MRNVNWLLEAGAKPGHERRPILAVNNIYAILRAVDERARHRRAAGFHGARDTPTWCASCPSSPGPPIEAYFVYPEELRSSKRIAVFRDFLLRKVTEGKNS